MCQCVKHTIICLHAQAHGHDCLYCTVSATMASVSKEDHGPLVGDGGRPKANHGHKLRAIGAETPRLSASFAVRTIPATDYRLCQLPSGLPIGQLLVD